MPIDCSIPINWEWVASNNNAISASASSVSAACFVLSVIITAIFAAVQLAKAKRNQKESTARNIFNDYLKKSLDNPILAYPSKFSFMIDLDNKTINGSLAEFERYEWYISLLIFSMKEILDILGKDKYWKLTVKRQLGYHVDYFIWRRKNFKLDKEAYVENDFIELAGDKVNSIINEIIKRRDSN